MYDAIIIGAGIGGLSCGLYLASKGYKILILEKSKQLGGRCSSIRLHGCQFDFGTLLFSPQFQQKLKPYGFRTPFQKARAIMKLPQGDITYPFSLHTLSQLRSVGVSYSDFITFLWRYLLANEGKNFSGPYPKFLDSLTSCKSIKDFFLGWNAMNAVVPSKLSTKSVWGLFHKYGYFENLYPPAGVSAVPNEISRLIKSYGGEIKTSSEVDKILIKDGKTSGVKYKNKIYSSKIVISNTGIKSTIFDLIGKKHFDSSYVKKIKKLEPTIPITSIFIQLKSKPPFGDIHIIGRVSNNLEQANKLAEKGRFNEDTPYIMSFPSLINSKASPKGTHCGTIQFTGDIPRKRTPELLKYVEETTFNGLRKSLIWHKTMVSTDYEKLINCPSYVYHTAPILDQVGDNRPDFRLPIKGLFCVGDSVKPDFPSVMQALDSGLECGMFINQNLVKNL